MKKEDYLSILKVNMMKTARMQYDYSMGGPEAVSAYKSACHRLKRASTLGEVFRIAKDMDLDLGKVFHIALFPFIGNLELTDFRDTPQKW